MDSRYTSQRVAMYSTKRECWFSSWALHDKSSDRYYVKLKAVRRMTWYLCAERPAEIRVKQQPVRPEQLFVLEYGTRLFRDPGEWTLYWKQLKARKKARRDQ